ncbi:hypothetical protein BN59_01078 [Legionella massiliensis]|uniref:Uncharacterized protein n=1 Tax=Legionella massiliensis TaxID=1034943 RepID=A0A078KUX8_9GAMM|nr:hypothetical protein [Legionella massiliensis]CDZ76802.1 hypothetical protein BN59_01078 [Legionella massiliensis]CEE12540.1 hypothetical protein BN1094_01078 [Legionella massiliensis]
MGLDLVQYEQLCAKLKSKKIYTSKYGLRFINSIKKELNPFVSYDGLPNIRNFFFEIVPIVRVAQHLNYSHFTYFGANFSFDGLLIDNKNKTLRHIECTSAIDGAKAELLNQHLIKYEEAPAYDKPFTNNKTKASGKRQVLFTPSQSHKDEDLVNLNLKFLVEDSINKKIKKSYDFKNAVLTIVFVEDGLWRVYDSIYQMLDSVIDAHMDQLKDSPFSDIFFIGFRNFFYTRSLKL